MNIYDFINYICDKRDEFYFKYSHYPNKIILGLNHVKLLYQSGEGLLVYDCKGNIDKFIDMEFEIARGDPNIIKLCLEEDFTVNGEQ